MNGLGHKTQLERYAQLSSNCKRLDMEDFKRRLDAADPMFRKCPHLILDELRTRDPVFQDPLWDRVVVTRADDVGAILTDRRLSADPFKARPTAYSRQGLSDDEHDRRGFIAMDDPDHARLRGLVASAFNARAIEALRPDVEQIATGLLAAIDPAQSFDLVAAFADPFPTLVIASMLGASDVDLPLFKRLCGDLRATDPSLRTEKQQRSRTAARAEIGDWLAERVRQRRKTPRADLISALVMAQTDNARLTDNEIVNSCRLLLVAGNITSTDLIGNGVVALLQHPSELDQVRDNPRLWPIVVEEVLRFDPPVTSWSRQALMDTQIRGCAVEAGQTITAMLLAANHDPELHHDPHNFDIGRGSQRHYSFGGGAHFCLGASLARLEAEVAYSALFQRFPHLRLAPDHIPLRRRHPPFSCYEAIRLFPS